MDPQRDAVYEEDPFFKPILRPFPPIKDGKIDTEQFLDAANGVVDMVDKLGHVFKPVKNDMGGNIEKINKRYQLDKLKNGTIHDMILAEKHEGCDFAITALLWLTRGLHFMEVFLEKIIKSSYDENPSDCLTTELSEAYTDSLKKYHKWLNQKVFLVICRMCPSRKDFLKSLSNNNDLKRFFKDTESFVETLRENRLQINCLYAANNLNNEDTV